MANLVKIKDVHLSTSQKTASAADCTAAVKLLDDAGVRYSHLWYEDSSQHPEVLGALSTWWWGREMGEKTQRKFEDFPILHWTECFDNWEHHQMHAAGLTEIQNCDLLKHVNLIAGK
jgi:hypothetical protein